VLDNLVDIMRYYDIFFTKNKVKQKTCARCGKLLIETYKTKKYCTVCSEKRQLESKRLWWNKNRGKEPN
jgi:ribosomal protein L37E